MDDRKSRTQKKNEARALQKLGEKLVAISSEQLESIDISDDLRNAVIVAGKTKSHGAKRRQLQYIGTLMRDINPEPIQNALANIKLGDYQKIRAFKKIEKCRVLPGHRPSVGFQPDVPQGMARLTWTVSWPASPS